MAAQHDLIVGRSWDSCIKWSGMINIRQYACTEMHGSVTVTTDGKPKLHEGQTGHHDSLGSQNQTSYFMWCHWEKKATCPKMPLGAFHAVVLCSLGPPRTPVCSNSTQQMEEHICAGSRFCCPLLFLHSGCECFQNETHCHN